MPSEKKQILKRTLILKYNEYKEKIRMIEESSPTSPLRRVNSRQHMEGEHNPESQEHVDMEEEFIIGESPEEYFIEDLIEMPYEEFIGYLDDYKKYVFDLFGISQIDIANVNKYAWFISIVLEFININKVIVNDVYEPNVVNERTHIQKKAFIEIKKQTDTQTKEEEHNIYNEEFLNSMCNIKYIKLSDLLHGVQFYLNGLLFFDFMQKKQTLYMKRFNITRLKFEVIDEIKYHKMSVEQMGRLMDCYGYKFYDFSSMVLHLMIDVFYLSNDLKLKCFLIHCIIKVVSNFYHSDFANEFRIRDLMAHCVHSTNPLLQKTMLYALLQLITTYENFLCNKTNILMEFNRAVSRMTYHPRQSTARGGGRGKGRTNKTTTNRKARKTIQKKNVTSKQKPGTKVKAVPSLNASGLSHSGSFSNIDSELSKSKEQIETAAETTKGSNKHQSKMNYSTGMEDTEDNEPFLYPEEEQLMNLQNKDIIHVLLVVSLYTPQILELLRINPFMYMECPLEELNSMKGLGLQIMSILFKEGFIKSSVLSPYVFCLAFSSDPTLRTTSDKLIQTMMKKEHYNFVNHIGDCFQSLLFYMIENYYMCCVTGRTTPRTTIFLFNKIEITFFQFFIKIYDQLPNVKTKTKFLKIVLKEMENACQIILYEKIKKQCLELNRKYSTRRNELLGIPQSTDQGIFVQTYSMNYIYTYIEQIHLREMQSVPASKRRKSRGTARNTQAHKEHEEETFEEIETVSNHSAEKKGKTKNKATRGQKRKTTNPKNAKKNNTAHLEEIHSNASETEEVYDDETYKQKIKEKYKYLKDKLMIIDEYSCINYFLSLYVQMIIYLLSYLSYSTYNELLFLIHDINKVYYIISASINVNTNFDNVQCDSEDMTALNETQEFLRRLEEGSSSAGNESDEMLLVNDKYQILSKQLNKIKCLTMSLLNNLTTNLIKHYKIDPAKLDNIDDYEDLKETKIEDDKKDDKKNILNYFAYLYECLEIYVEDNNEIVEKFAKSNLNFNVNNDYVDELIHDGKNKRYARKKKQQEARRQRRITAKKNT